MTELISKINENTSVPLKIVIPVVIAVITATWAISVQISALRADLVRINGKIDGAWSVQNMELWAAKMQRENPALRVPYAKDGFSIERP